MKVKYVGDYYRFSLKHGKEYTVQKEIDGMYFLIDESGEEYAFAADEFKIV